MKVKISKYPGRLNCNIHTDHMNRKYGFAHWPGTQSSVDNMLERIEDKLQSVYNVINWIWFDRRTRKVDVRIDRTDTWSMDNTLAHIIVPMLKQLQDTKHGSPLVADSDVPKDLRSTCADPKENEYDTDSNHHLRWDWVLNEMIWAFEQKSRDDWEGDYYEYEYEDKESADGLVGLKVVSEDPKGRAAHQKRMTKGFKLFGKYYESLWD